MERNRAGSVTYWVLVVFPIVFGVLGILSIGLPSLLLGVTLAILWPRRHTTGVIASGCAAILGLTVGYVLVVPLGCTVIAGPLRPGIRTVCTNILGIDYPGTGANHPSLLPAMIAGIVVAVLCAAGTWWLARGIAARRAPLTPIVP